MAADRRNATMKLKCLRSLALSITSASVFLGSMVSLNVQDRISVIRGFFYSGLGLVHFVLLNDFLNKLLAGIRQYSLKSDALDIANKLVSAVQAVYSCLAGFIVCRSSCSRGLTASHFMSESYAWFGAAYFFYDLWSMYKVHIAKVADKLFLVKLKAAANGAAVNYRKGQEADETNRLYDATMTKKSNGNGHQSFLDEDQMDNLKYREICDGYENEIQVLEDGQPNFCQYLKSEPLMVGHHIFIGSFGLSVIVFLRGGLGDCIFSHIYIMEASTPFVSFRSILSTLGMKSHRAYLVNGILMMVTFFIFRILLLPYLFLWYAATINQPVLSAIAALPRGCKISICILFLPQYYWFYLIVLGAMKVFWPKKGGKAAASSKGTAVAAAAPTIGDGPRANGFTRTDPSKVE